MFRRVELVKLVTKNYRFCFEIVVFEIALNWGDPYLPLFPLVTLNRIELGDPYSPWLH